MAWKKKKEEEAEEAEESEEIQSLRKQVEELQKKAKTIKEKSSEPPPFPGKELEKERVIVVRELPTQEIRSYKSEDGIVINLITVEEALTQIMGSEE